MCLNLFQRPVKIGRWKSSVPKIATWMHCGKWTMSLWCQCAHSCLSFAGPVDPSSAPTVWEEVQTVQEDHFVWWDLANLCSRKREARKHLADLSARQRLDQLRMLFLSWKGGTAIEENFRAEFNTLLSTQDVLIAKAYADFRFLGEEQFKCCDEMILHFTTPCWPRELTSLNLRMWEDSAPPWRTREALLSEAGFENVFRTQNWARRRKLFCRWFCFLLGQAGCISVAAWTQLKVAFYYFVSSGGLIVCC